MNTNIWNHDEAKEMIEEKKRLVKEGHEDESIYKLTLQKCHGGCDNFLTQETKPISDEEAEMLFKKRPN